VLVDQGLQQQHQIETQRSPSTSSTQTEHALPDTYMQAVAQTPPSNAMQTQLASSPCSPFVTLTEPRVASDTALQCSLAAMGSASSHSAGACVADTASQQKIAQHGQSQAASAEILLCCGAGLPNAYLELTFEQLLLLSKGQAVDLVHEAAPKTGARHLFPFYLLCKM